MHDSGAERVLVADVAERLGVPFAPLSGRRPQRLPALLDPGLEPTNPLDVWGTGADTETLFADCLTALADDAGVDVVALAVDLVPEYDGDEAFPRALEALVDHTDKPVVGAGQPRVGGRPAVAAARLRARGDPGARGDPRRGCARSATCSAAPPRPRPVAVRRRGAPGALGRAGSRPGDLAVDAARRLRDRAVATPRRAAAGDGGGGGSRAGSATRSC